MGQELTLFSEAELPPATTPQPGKVRHTDPATSQAAALKNPGKRSELRGHILELFFENPYLMFTNDELTVALDERWPTLEGGHQLGTVDRRRAELVDMGWLCTYPEGSATPLTRATRRGAYAQVWCLTAAAKRDGWTTDREDPE